MTGGDAMLPTKSFLDLERQMVGDIYASREVMDNLIVLCDDFGPRFAGTPEERKAADFIAETFTVIINNQTFVSSFSVLNSDIFN